MESYILTPLSPLLQSSPSQTTKTLPELRPLFFVPPLDDRPQNPIVEALLEVQSLPDILEHDNDICNNDKLVLDDHWEEDIWTAKAVRRLQNQNLSWDALRPTYPKEAMPTPFLSEQSNDVFDAVRHHVRPRLDDTSLRLRYILPTELLDNLLTNIVGNSSPLYIWNSEEETFSPFIRDSVDDTKVVVIIEGLDDVASETIIQRFLNIGTFMRRLELLVMTLQRRDSPPTTHAFSHALATVLIHIRTTLTHRPPYPPTHITSLWLHYANTEAVLSALAVLCNRSRTPPYDPLPESPAGLLSHIYNHLERHIERGYPRSIIATLAYILTTSSREYFTDLGESLGLFEPSRAPWLIPGHRKRDVRRSEEVLVAPDDVELDRASVSSVSDDLDDGDAPNFIPADLAEALPAARKSLRILQAADPDHPLCVMPVAEVCRWVWSPEEVERLWECRAQDAHDNDTAQKSPPTPPDAPVVPLQNYHPELEQFRMFDLEPGAHLAQPPTPSHPTGFSSFLASFPDRLPPLTPRLQHLATAVLQPLYTRTAELSSSLLELFLSSLHLETHLVLLRSYMLVTLPSFRTRLINALFSDAADCDGASAEHSVGLGLSVGTSERGTWPPGGADLSLSLRSVIVDSLGERPVNLSIDNEADAEDAVWREGEVRLGFALRDLPIADGKERWLNPMSIEALDFLYLDYKPPHPLDVVITPDILSKYYRTFTFLLRLFRAETGARIAYRSTFKSSHPIFAYVPKAQETLLRLRFQMQEFIMAFVTYIFDSVIGGNFDLYLRRISELRNLRDDRALHEITNVFALRDSHSELLDHILSGCLLRTAQRAAGDALRDLLDLVLRFGTMITRIQRGNGVIDRQAENAKEVYELYDAFQAQMLIFIKAIQALHAKDQANDKNPRPSQGSRVSRMEDLLTRVDPTRWWRRKIET